MRKPMTIGELQAVITSASKTIAHSRSTIRQCQADIAEAKALIRLLEQLEK